MQNKTGYKWLYIKGRHYLKPLQKGKMHSCKIDILLSSPKQALV